MSVFTMRLSGASTHLAYYSHLPLCSHHLCFLLSDPRTSLYRTRRMCFWCVPCPHFSIRELGSAERSARVGRLHSRVLDNTIPPIQSLQQNPVDNHPVLVEADLCRAVSQLCMQVAVVLVIMVSTERLLFATRKTPVFSRQ